MHRAVFPSPCFFLEKTAFPISVHVEIFLSFEKQDSWVLIPIWTVRRQQRIPDDDS